jgi:putative protein-disulfide isomerase
MRPTAAGPPLACDTDSGTCTVSGAAAARPIEPQARAKVLYVTDPICSGCWALEPAWRKLRYRYGDLIEVQHVYGGLLPGWQGFADRGAGITSPAHVAPHWAEVAERTGQPIDPSVWETDPPASSYPPSKAAHIVRMLDPAAEEAFLRRIREAVFLEARNIARPEVLVDCAEAVGLDRRAFAVLLDADAGASGFAADLEQARALGVRAFPTLLFTGPTELARALSGNRPYPALESALLDVLGIEASHHDDPPSASAALRAYSSGTLLEFATLMELDRETTAAELAAAGASPRFRGPTEYWVTTGPVASSGCAGWENVGA